MEQTVVKQKPAVEAAVTPTRETAQKPKIKSPASKKRRKWIKRLIILAVLAALVVFLFKSCSGTGSIMAAGSYIPAVAARQELLAQNEEYSWLTLNFYRGRLVVEASQLRPAPELPQGRSCDLVSVADGVVLEVNIQSGQPLCSPGQTVAKGQQLAAGRYQDRDGRLFEVQSAGEVMAQVTFRCQAQQPMETTVALPQSGGRRGRRLLVLGQTIPLGPQPQAGPEEQASVTSRPLTILGFALPATLEETWVTGSVQQTVTFTEEQALELAKLACREQLLQQLPGAEIQSERVYSRLEQGKLQVEMELVAVAQIAQQRPCEN